MEENVMNSKEAVDVQDETNKENISPHSHIQNVDKDTHTEPSPEKVVSQIPQQQEKVEPTVSESKVHEAKEADSIDLADVKKKATNFFKDMKRSLIPGKKNTSSHKPNISPGPHKKVEGASISSVITFTQKHKKWLIPLVCILIAILLSTHFRMMSSTLPITDSWAENTVEGFYQNQITNQINQQYPNLPNQNKNALIEQELSSFREANSDQIKGEIAQISREYKSNFQNDNGETYLLAIDPYLWYSEARNYVEHGHLGDTLIDGESYFSLRDGRLDKKVSTQLNPVAGAYLYKILKIFNPNISLMRALFLLPVVLIGLAIIPAFFIARRFSGNVGGFFASVFLGLNGALLGRTPAGFADTDAYNVLFPLFITWLVFEAYYAKKHLHRVLLGLGAGLGVGLYAAAWSGWSHIFLFGLAALILTALFLILQEFIKHKFKHTLSSIRTHTKLKEIGVLLVSFLVGSGIFVSLFKSFEVFSGSFSRLIRFISLKEVGISSIWPNVLTTVAEFNTTSFSSIISQMGGNLLFFIALLGLLFILFVKGTSTTAKKAKQINLWYIVLAAVYYLFLFSMRDNLNDAVTFIVVMAIPLLVGFVKILYLKEKVDVMFPIYLSLWMLGSAYAFSKGIRFALLLTSPFVLLLGVGLGFLFVKGRKMLSSGIKLDSRISGALVFLVLALLLITPLSQAQSIGQNEVPSMNDAWYNSLIKIRDAAPDSIITSWWDFGHWFVAIAERRVTFDGGDQGERIHWAGKSLLTTSEQESIGILRMLNCAQETAPHKLEEFTGDALNSVHIINEAILEDTQAGAQRVYENNGLTQAQAQEMLEYTHCENLLPNYYITSEDMIGKAGVWGHFGSWDFDKAAMYQGAKKLARSEASEYLTTNFDLTISEADKVHQEIQTTEGDRWIAPWPGYLTGVSGCQKLSDNEMSCPVSLRQGSFDLRVDLTTFDVEILGSDGAMPNSVVYGTQSEVIIKDLNGNTGFSLVLIPHGEEYRALLADPLQAGGMFTRLFFFDGLGLECFNKFDDVQQITGGRVVTWEVDYSCN